MSLSLEDILSNRKIRKTDKILSILSHANEPLSLSGIRIIANANGLKLTNKDNISSLLSASKFALQSNNLWKLNRAGKSYLSDKGYISEETILTPVILELENISRTILRAEYQLFVSELISCIKAKAYRAAIVLSWVGAIYIIQIEIVSRFKDDFNIALQRQYPKDNVIDSSDDFSSIKESHVLEQLSKIKLFNKSEVKELKICLDRRNDAGHPNSLAFDELTTAHHLSNLINIVFSKLNPE